MNRNRKGESFTNMLSRGEEEQSQAIYKWEIQVKFLLYIYRLVYKRKNSRHYQSKLLDWEESERKGSHARKTTIIFFTYIA
jgi:hypothetical protein